MAMMLTTDLEINISYIISPTYVYNVLNKHDKATTRATTSNFQRTALGNLISVNENMIKRAFSTKYVRTALFSQCPIMKFSKSKSKYDAIFDEYKIGHVFTFTALHTHTAMSFENIQIYII